MIAEHHINGMKDTGNIPVRVEVPALTFRGFVTFPQTVQCTAYSKSSIQPCGIAHHTEMSDVTRSWQSLDGIVKFERLTFLAHSRAPLCSHWRPLVQ